MVEARTLSPANRLGAEVLGALIQAVAMALVEKKAPYICLKALPFPGVSVRA